MYNPWGTREWTGDYSKESKKWASNKVLKKELHNDDLDDS